MLREKHRRTGHKPNAWHYGAVFLGFFRAGDEAGALAIQSEWRSLQGRDAVEQLGRSGASCGDAGGVVDSRAPGLGGRGLQFSVEGAGRGAVAATGFGADEDNFRRSGGGEGSAAGAPGDRFRPSDLLSLALSHADIGAWSECLDVLDTAQEVSTKAGGCAFFFAFVFLFCSCSCLSACWPSGRKSTRSRVSAPSFTVRTVHFWPRGSELEQGGVERSRERMEGGR